MSLRLRAAIGVLTAVLLLAAVAAYTISSERPQPRSGAAGSAAGAPTGAEGGAEPTDAAAEREVALVTGSTGGLGREVALRLGAAGAHVIVHGRDRERGLEVVEEIEAAGAGSASFQTADLASLREVRELAETVLAEHDRLDLLVNNAGIWLDGEERLLSEDGHELTFQVNFLSHFLLTRLLLPRIVESAPARIVNVASSAQQPLDFTDPMLEEGYSDGRAYAQSKLAQILFTIDLAEELEGTEVVVTSLHPATFMDTDMVLSRGAEPRATVQEGADAVLNLIESPDIESGSYHRGLEPASPHEQALDPEARRALRELSRELAGIRR